MFVGKVSSAQISVIKITLKKYSNKTLKQALLQRITMRTLFVQYLFNPQNTAKQKKTWVIRPIILIQTALGSNSNPYKQLHKTTIVATIGLPTGFFFLYIFIIESDDKLMLKMQFEH